MASGFFRVRRGRCIGLGARCGLWPAINCRGLLTAILDRLLQSGQVLQCLGQVHAGVVVARRNLTRNRVRSLLTVLGIAIGVVAVASLGLVGNTLQADLTGALAEICMAVTRHDECYAVPFTWFDVVDSELPLGHGGPVETSMMLAIAPDLIREDRYPEAAEGAGDSFGVRVAGTNLAYDFEEFSDSGNLQDPTPASAEEGERLLAESAEACVEVLAAMAERERSGSDPAN